MAVTYGFYDSLNHDRLYNAQQMSAIFDGIINDGVFMSVGNQFHTVAGTGMQVIVKSGRAWFDSTWTLNDAEYPLSIDAADVLLTRIDAVVLEVNSEVATRANTIKVVKGTPASTPAKPTLTNTAAVHQHALAYVTVAKNTTAITNSMIEIVVGKTETPYVTAILQTTDITDLFKKWENDFQAWFETVKGTLDGDVALNLQNQIDHCVKKADKATSADIEAGTADKWVDASLFSKEHYKIGDICHTMRNINNSKWQLCNGEKIKYSSVSDEIIDVCLSLSTISSTMKSSLFDKLFPTRPNKIAYLNNQYIGVCRHNDKILIQYSDNLLVNSSIQYDVPAAESSSYPNLDDVHIYHIDYYNNNYYIWYEIKYGNSNYYYTYTQYMLHGSSLDNLENTKITGSPVNNRSYYDSIQRQGATLYFGNTYTGDNTSFTAKRLSLNTLSISSGISVGYYTNRYGGNVDFYLDPVTNYMWVISHCVNSNNAYMYIGYFTSETSDITKVYDGSAPGQYTISSFYGGVHIDGSIYPTFIVYGRYDSSTYASILYYNGSIYTISENESGSSKPTIRGVMRYINDEPNSYYVLTNYNGSGFLKKVTFTSNKTYNILESYNTKADNDMNLEDNEHTTQNTFIYEKILGHDIIIASIYTQFNLSTPALSSDRTYRYIKIK